MDLIKFDIMLDESDEDFTRDLMRALGVGPNDAVSIATPTFDRQDGRLVSYLPNMPEEYEALKLMLPSSLKKIGCQMWEVDQKGNVHWLYPSEWYDSIPDGTEIITLSGVTKKFERGSTSNDKRFGALSYGFKQARH